MILFLLRYLPVTATTFYTVTHRDSPSHTVASPLQTVTSTLPTVTHRFFSFFHRFLPFPTIISFTWILWQQEIRKTYKKYTNQSNKTNNKYTVSVFGASNVYSRDLLTIIIRRILSVILSWLTVFIKRTRWNPWNALLETLNKVFDIFFAL